MRILAVMRNMDGELRRQHVLIHLAQKAVVIRVPVCVKRMDKLLNLIKTFSINRVHWRRRNKMNTFIFKKRSIAIGETINNEYGNNYDVILLFEALYSPGLVEGLCKPYVVYEDTTPIILMKKWPKWVPETVLTKEYQLLQTSVYQNAERILTSNELARKSMIEHYGVSPEAVTTVYQGCNFSPSIEGRNNINDKQILFVGYDFEIKGGYVLLEAFRKVRSKIPEAQLIIVGDPLSISEDGVITLGRITDRAKLMELYKRSLVFVQPSFFDAMPNTVMEAMGLGLAIVISDSCGSLDFVEDGINGFVVPTGNPKILADRLIKLLSDVALARQIGQAAFKLANTHFNWAIVSDKILRILNSISKK